MLLYGAGGHAKVVIDCLLSNRMKNIVLFDDNESITDLNGIKVVGKYIKEYMPDEQLIISIGDNHIRYNVFKKIHHHFGYVFHPSALIAEKVNIGEGTVVFHNSVIQCDASVGRHCIINTSSIIEHDCRLDDFVHVSPNATINGDVALGFGTHIGASAVVIPGVKIGDWVTIGAGAVVINDVPDGAVVVGNPAKIIKYKDVIQ